MDSLRMPPQGLKELYDYPHLFRPFLKAYGLGFLYYLGPRIFGLVCSKVKQKISSKKNSVVSPAIVDIFRKSSELHRFPAFCGVAIGGWHVLQPIFEKFLGTVGKFSESLGAEKTTGEQRRRVATFLASASAAAAAIRQLNSRSVESPAGRTLDLTLFAVVRALDVVIGEIWARGEGARRVRSKTFTRLDGIIKSNVDVAVFAVSAAVIMFSWFYEPEKLPSSYNKWITGIAEADTRLITALRRIRSGEFVYGKETGQAPLLQSLCEDLGLPKVWGDPAFTKRIPCELVHHGFSKSCELHACWRFWNAWKAAFTMYLGLNFLVRLRNGLSVHTSLRAISDAAKSAAFLGAFVGTFWYTICLTRTRLGPLFWPQSDQLFLENLCVKMGCLSCGWSILVEPARRRLEMAFFVAPRALGTLMPRKYDRKHLWKETLAFAVSAGIVFTALKENPKRRGFVERRRGIPQTISNQTVTSWGAYNRVINFTYLI
ncbi:hypothetical protein C7212DRAFT_277511 [Tuber magnatum]|uniref:Transmembrane protein 135 N-terminal domain-containing protein n=1 Tax=Tuber magnatum TaxID=42249 RepID=A0A317ST15_9PEZI|nr:hypothetical protein C7212DRAFT_277511 [Tuber magnatum]